jgi:t-SNARE complex subunit (syntaxin)
MTVQNAPELKKQLEAVLTEGEVAKRQQMQLEIQRYEEQIKKLQSRVKQDPAKSVRSQLKRFQKNAQAGPKTDKRRRK